MLAAPPKPTSRDNLRLPHRTAHVWQQQALRLARGTREGGGIEYLEGVVGVAAEEAGEHVGDGSAEGGGGLRAPIHAERSILGGEEPAAAAQQ